MTDHPDLEITWEVDDGYVGGSRPYTLTIPGDELADCDNDTEREDLITEHVQEHFSQEVTWFITSRREVGP